jgi:hypothetical protein
LGQVGQSALLDCFFSGVTLYRTQLIQKDDIRVVVDGTLEVRPDKGGLLLDQDQQLTFINSGNRAAVITEIYGELVLVTATDTMRPVAPACSVIKACFSS